MSGIETKQKKESSFQTWMAALIVTVIFLAWGLFIFFTVGVKWPPAWDFGAMPDVPGLSVYSTHPPKKSPTGGTSPLLQGGELAPQHVKGPTLNYRKEEQSE